MNSGDLLVRDLISEFNNRMTDRDNLEAEILVVESKLTKVDSELQSKSKKLAEVLVCLDEKQTELNEVKQLLSSKSELESIVEKLRVELSIARTTLRELQTKNTTLTETIDNQLKELAALTTSCTEYMKNVSKYTNELNIKRRELLNIEIRQKNQHQEQLEIVNKEREINKKERNELAELRKSCDLKLEKIYYASKDMPKYIKGIQAQFDILGIKVPFKSMLDKVVGGK